MPQSGPNHPDHVFERDGHRYVCWLATEGENPAGLAAPAHAHWNINVDGRQYRVFDGVPDDLSYAKVRDFEDRVHDWYKPHILGVTPVGIERD